MHKEIAQRLVFASLLAGLAAVAGCGTEECTQIGCQSGIALRIDAASWSQATYSLSVSGGNETFDCTFNQPDDLDCMDQDGQPSTHNIQDPDLFGLPILPGQPEELEVLLMADGVELLSTTVRPNYQASQPNGPGCGPVCQNALVELAVP